MTLKEIPEASLRDRLSGDGVLLRIGPFAVRVGSGLPELHDAIRLLYANFPVLNGDEIEDFEVRAEPTGRLFRRFSRWAVSTIDGHPKTKPFRRGVALPMLEWTLNWCVFTKPNHCLILHAAVVERNGRGLVLSGQAGAGKSTLATALSARGWRLLSDEVAMFPHGRRELLPVPLPMSLKNESIRLIREFAPELVIGPAVPGTRKGTVAHVRPPDESLRRSHETAEPVGIIFPSYTPGSGCRLYEVPRAEAMMRLADESFNYSVLGIEGFESLADVVDPCRCFDLVYDDLEAAIARLREL